MGRDETGVDCWGLVRLFYSQELGIELPEYSSVGHGINDEGELAKEIHARMQNWRQVETPEQGDCVLLNIAGAPTHIGIVVTKNTMLHVSKSSNSVIERFTGMKWQRRIEGFYSYVAG